MTGEELYALLSMARLAALPETMEASDLRRCMANQECEPFLDEKGPGLKFRSGAFISEWRPSQQLPDSAAVYRDAFILAHRRELAASKMKPDNHDIKEVQSIALRAGDWLATSRFGLHEKVRWQEDGVVMLEDDTLFDFRGVKVSVRVPREEAPVR